MPGDRSILAAAELVATSHCPSGRSALAWTGWMPRASSGLVNPRGGVEENIRVSALTVLADHSVAGTGKAPTIMLRSGTIS